MATCYTRGVNAFGIPVRGSASETNGRPGEAARREKSSKSDKS